MTLRRGGYIPDLDAHVAEDLALRPASKLLGSRPSSRRGPHSHLRFLDHVPQQGQSSSCVGQARSSAVFLGAAIAGRPVARPSAKGIYDVARLMGSPGQLVDIGCRPRLATEGVAKFGLVAAERWPLTDANVDELPPFDLFTAGAHALDVVSHRLDTTADLVEPIYQALDAGHMVDFGTEVDAAYSDYMGGVWAGMTGRSVGGHMQLVVDYDESGNLIVLNSWGPFWGLGGVAVVSPKFFRSGAVSDAFVTLATPREIR